MLDPRESPTHPALGFLYGRIDYERTPPASAREFKLHVMRTLLERLGNPQADQRIVHVAGTKGKGSTASMLASVLRQAGLRTALYTSPHLEAIEERLAVDGQPCTREEFVELVELVRGPVEELDREAAQAGLAGGGPTFFDIVTAVALLHFQRRGCDATVLEVGLGGRLDSTNICRPAVSVITTISLDHTQQLGSTLALIAGEKAGIIKPGVPVVSGVIPNEPRQVIHETARRIGAPLTAILDDFGYDESISEAVERSAEPSATNAVPPTRLNYWEKTTSGIVRWPNVAVGLRGSHQALNAAIALATLERLRAAGWNLPESAVRRGLETVTCPARVEIVGHRPTVILDAAHNVASIEALLEVLRRDFAKQPRLCVFAVNRDKDVPGILERLLPAFPQVIVTQFHNSPRGVPVDELASLARQLAPPTTQILVAPDTRQAWLTAQQLATPDHLICCTGSFFLAAEMRPLLSVAGSDVEPRVDLKQS